MTSSRTSILAMSAALALVAASPSVAQQDATVTAESGDGNCVQAPEPVVSLAYGSRYTAESENRADLDEEANADVDEALEPIDEFIVELADGVTRAQSGEEDAQAAADCVIDAVHVWAEANALSQLETMNAKISSPSRVAGIAMAYLGAKPHTSARDLERQEVIEDWLEERVLASMDFFNNDAPPNASRNNLRAWAGFAAAAVAEATGNALIADWAAGTVELVACQADEDGALPLEMERGQRALHYHLHAVGPLVMSAALLSDEETDLFEICNGALHRIVAFVPTAFENPELVNAKAGEEQTYFNGDELRGFELAWAEPYLSRFDSPELADLVEPLRPLANSKLGGAQGLLR